MITTVNRAPITDRLITELEGDSLPVGDNNVPTDAYGWQGEPNADGSTFIPWMSINGGAAQRQSGSLGNSSSEWQLSYTINYAGVSRKQLDWIADRARNRLVSIARESVTTGSGNWKIQQIRCTVVGATNRVGIPFPDYFTQADLYEVWISKEL